MPAVATRLGSWRARLTWFVVTAMAGSGCDLRSKAWAERTLSDLPDRSVMVLEPWLELSLTYNRGTAFSLVRDLGDLRWLFGVLALVMVVMLVMIVVRSRRGALEVFALGAIAGGAVGNGVDRLWRFMPDGQTGVVDFIKINYPWGGSWPAFNVADMLIAVGVTLFIIDSLRWHKTSPPRAEPDLSAGAP